MKGDMRKKETTEEKKVLMFERQVTDDEYGTEVSGVNKRSDNWEKND